MGTMLSRILIAVLVVALFLVIVVVRFGLFRPAEEAEVGDLSWMAGYWRGGKENVTIEEVWLPPSGGVLLGMNRSVDDDGNFAFEYLRVEDREDGVYYIAAPGGGTEFSFRLEEIEKNEARFVNESHDFPKEIVYRLDGKRKLHVRIEGEDEDGERRVEEWRWRRGRIGERR